LKTDEALKDKRITVIKEPPPAGKDFNDTLQTIIKLKKGDKDPYNHKYSDFSH
jgi:hypothetical protein